MNRSHDAQGFALLESITILFCLVDDGYRNINPNAQRYESLKKPSDSVLGAVVGESKMLETEAMGHLPRS